MTDEELNLLAVHIKNKNHGNYALAEYMIKKFNITEPLNLSDNDKHKIRVETQRILKQEVTERDKLDVLKKIKEFTK